MVPAWVSALVTALNAAWAAGLVTVPAWARDMTRETVPGTAAACAAAGARNDNIQPHINTSPVIQIRMAGAFVPADHPAYPWSPIHMTGPFHIRDLIHVRDLDIPSIQVLVYR